ncbi:unnamed protein product [Prunus armeniaca]
MSLAVRQGQPPSWSSPSQQGPGVEAPNLRSWVSGLAGSRRRVGAGELGSLISIENFDKRGSGIEPRFGTIHLGQGFFCELVLQHPFGFFGCLFLWQIRDL